MSEADLLAAAAAELYSADPDEFVQRRSALVSRAREAGQAAAGRRIAALRKPTRSAWVVNQLARSDPGVASELVSLGEELRTAQRSLDGEAIRELSRQRRQLVEDLVRRALELSGQHSPSAALREEVSGTLSAAVADPEVAGQFAAGTLERAAHHEGFGLAGPPVLTLVPPPDGDEPADRQSRGARSRSAGPATRRGPGRIARQTERSAAEQETRAGAEPARAERQRRRQDEARAEAERAAAERERRRRDALAEAESQAADAEQAAATATTAEEEQEATVRELEQQLAQARLLLADVRQRARRARAGQRRARQAADRLRGNGPSGR